MKKSWQKTIHKMLSYVLVLSMVGSMIPMSVFAVYEEAQENTTNTPSNAHSVIADITHDISSGSIEITESGTYTITQSNATATSNQIIIKGDIDVTLILTDVNISVLQDIDVINADRTNVPNLAPVEILDGARVTLELDGTNIIKSKYLFAGIHIAEGTSLTIKDENDIAGSLDVTGGDGTDPDGPDASLKNFSSSAGIGGNGAYAINSDSVGSQNFGSLEILSGTIIATGGMYFHNGNTGAGAGIGTGGTIDWSSADYQWSDAHKGTVTIKGGMVTAKGGASASGETAGYYGGAGIGSGGSSSTITFNFMVINIEGGTVIATGVSGAAGIGGGGKGHGCEINITGGDITATAIGGTNIFTGGAGIGGGNAGMSFSYSDPADKSTWSEITIIDAKVIATAAGASAGIGSGGVGQAVYSITIGGSSEVTATGGSISKYGGAGIGGGEGSWTEGTFTIKDTAKVTAIGGYQAAGIGSAAIKDTDFTSNAEIIIQDNATVTAYGGDGGAGIGGGYYSFVSGNIYITDTATVMALGGTDAAGIGTGRGVSGYYFNMNEVIVDGTPTIVAVAGENAQAIGLGSGTDPATAGFYNGFKVGENATDIWLFNRNDSNSALLGIVESTNSLNKDYSKETASLSETEGGYYSAAPVVIWDNTLNGNFENANSSAVDATWDKELSVDTDKYTWDYTENSIITIYKNDRVLKSFDLLSDLPENYEIESISNWATFDLPVNYTVSYDLNGGAGETVPDPTDYAEYDAVTITGESATRSGYTFAGWLSDYDAKIYTGDGKEEFTMPAKDVVLTAQWVKDADEPDPTPDPTPESHANPQTGIDMSKMQQVHTYELVVVSFIYVPIIKSWNMQKAMMIKK